MRALWSLPKAAPALLRHIGAYIDLIGLDIARAKREMVAQLLATVVVAVCAMFALLLACIGVIAYTWDTPYRLPAIAWMFGGFVLISVIALVYRAKLTHSPFLADVHREWREDRVILDRVLSPEKD